MSYAPAWLEEEDIRGSTKKSPSSQKSVKSSPKKSEKTVKSHVYDNSPGWEKEPDIESPKTDQVNPIAKQKSSPIPSPTKQTSGSLNGSSGDLSDIDEETKNSMRNWHLGLRVLYCGAAIFLAAVAALGLSGQSDLGIVFMCCYVFFFATLICCFEVALSVSFIV